MTLSSRRALGIALGAVLLTLLVWAFLRGRQEIARERAREAPVVPPTRVQAFGEQAGIVLDSATERRVGMVTTVLAEARRAARVSLTGELVRDPDAVETLRAPVAGRLVAAGNRRWPALGDSVAAGQVIGQVSDARPLASTRSGIVTSVGARPGEIVQAGQELVTITDFAHPLTRIVWRPDAPAGAPRAAVIAPLGTAQLGVSADLVGPAPQADSVTGAAVFLYRLSQGWPGARPGQPVTAGFPDPRATRHGVFVPAAATVQWNGFLWVYVQRGRGHFARVRLDTSAPVDGGWLASAGIAPGDTVVVRGAEQLLSEEFRAGSAPAGAEPGQ
jgi:biotin carboxyl carrier protein